MKHFINLLFVAAICAAANPDGVPKEAVEVKPGLYRYVDADKKAWLYSKSPFGYMRSSEDAPKAKADVPETPVRTNPEKTPFGESRATANAPATKVTEQGDSLRFERPSPFGVYRWTRKKADLTDDEKKLWDASRTAPAKADTK